ncbi:hypothetical protein, partial [Burkholderia pseudomallei]|uniref:hypothetical protein n=1 Tax=Burkholderia pseudomallei TaxID=28450 RepID=UPI001C4BC628
GARRRPGPRVRPPRSWIGRSDRAGSAASLASVVPVASTPKPTTRVAAFGTAGIGRAPSIAQRKRRRHYRRRLRGAPHRLA